MGEKQEVESDDREDGSTIESKSAAADRLKSFHLLELALSIDTVTNRKREQIWRTKSWRRGTTTRSVLRKNRWEVSVVLSGQSQRLQLLITHMGQLRVTT